MNGHRYHPRDKAFRSCASGDCPESAVAHVDGMDLCEAHYDEHQRKCSERYCKEKMGLNSAKECKEYFRKNVSKLFNKKVMV